jgi:hypothetical protein
LVLSIFHSVFSIVASDFSHCTYSPHCKVPLCNFETFISVLQNPVFHTTTCGLT